METSGKTVAVRCLTEAIDGCGIPRTVLAVDYAAVSEGQFSKLTRSASIELFDKLPNAVVIPFLVRFGRERGFEVRETTPREIDDEIVAVMDRLVVLARLRGVRPRAAKADLAAPAESRRRA